MHTSLFPCNLLHKAKLAGCNAEQDSTAGGTPEQTQDIIATQEPASRSQTAGLQARKLAKKAWAKLGMGLLTAQEGRGGFVRVLAEAGMDGLAKRIVRHLVSPSGPAVAMATQQRHNIDTFQGTLQTLQTLQVCNQCLLWAGRQTPLPIHRGIHQASHLREAALLAVSARVMFEQKA